MPGEGSTVAVVWAGPRDEAGKSPALERTRLSAIAEALRDAGLDPVPVAYLDEHAELAKQELLAVDAALIWVNPIDRGRDRTRLDTLLREVAAAGVLVSAHPDVIQAMGTKEVLYAARDLPFGSDTRRYATGEELRAHLPECLRALGPRVLKHARGNGGNAVWKVELTGDATAGQRVLLRHAQRGSQPEELDLAQLLERFAAYLDGGGVLIDQPFQPRLQDGMVRCYLVGDRVAGFGEQLVNALYPAPAVGAAAPEPGRRLYYPPTREDFQRLKQSVERQWLPVLQERLGVASEALPVIWDADFLYGEKDADARDSYMLCEINVSAVFPFPDEALRPLAAEVRRRLAGS